MSPDDQPRAGDSSPRTAGQLAVLLPGRSVFAELLTVALRASDAQIRPERDGELFGDIVVDIGEVADALHLRLEGVYGHPDRPGFVPMPPLGELMTMLTDTVLATFTAPPSSSSADRIDLAGFYLYLFLARPRTEDTVAPGHSAAAVSRRTLAAFAAGDLDAEDTFGVAQALMFDSGTRLRLRELLDIASSFSAAVGADAGERMPDRVWRRSLRTIAALQREREQGGTDPETESGTAP